MKRSVLKTLGLALSLLLGMAACTDVEITSPKGAQGDRGVTGASAYDTWLELLEKGTYPDWKGGKNPADFILFLTGKDGKNGLSAYEDWKKLIADGTTPNPHDPSKMWDPKDDSKQKFYEFLTGAKGAKGEDGQDGKTPHIGENGNWFIGDKDTNVPARGQDGKTPHIGDNGNWFIGDKDTNVPARGQDGQDGTNGADGTSGADGKDGLSAYDLWKKEAATGTLPNPHPNVDGYEGPTWPKDKVTVEDFWFYLRGEDGTNSSELISDYILAFRPDQEKQDGPGYNASNGDAVIAITDRDGKPLAEGSTVTFGTKFGFPAEKTYTVTSNSTIIVPRSDQPENGKNFADRSGRATVVDKESGKTLQTNIFSFPTKPALKSKSWKIYNDWGPGLIRLDPQFIYLIDAAGPTSQVEIDSNTKEFMYGQIYKVWYGAKDDSNVIPVLNITDQNGSVLAGKDDARIAPIWYVSSEGNFSARRQLIAQAEGDTQKNGQAFSGDAGRQFVKESYYVQTNEVKPFFGIEDDIQSPVVEVPSMPIVPLILCFELADGKITGELLPMTEEDRGRKIARMQADGSGVFRPVYERFADSEKIYIMFTKPNIAYMGSATFGDLRFEIPATTKVEDMDGMTVLVSSPEQFTPVSDGEEAYFANQQQHLRHIIMGKTKVENGILKIIIANDLGIDPSVKLESGRMCRPLEIG